MARVRPKYPRRGKLSRIGLPVLVLLLLCAVAGGIFYYLTREDRQVEQAVGQLADSLVARSDRAADGGEGGPPAPGTPAPSARRDTAERSAPLRGAPGQGVSVRNDSGRSDSGRSVSEQGAVAVSAAPLPSLPGSGLSPASGTLRNASRSHDDASRAPVNASHLPGDSSFPPGGSPPATPDGSPPSPSSSPDSNTLPETNAVANKDQDGPFAGMTLERIAAGFAETYGNRRPAHWGERLPGITWRLPVPGTAASGTIPSAPGTTASGTVPSAPDKPVLALTLDACDGGKGTGYDAGIIALLREKNIPATIFVTSIWMRNHPDILRELAADPLFEIAAHGARHRPCSVNGNSVYRIKGTASFAELVREVEGNVRDIRAATGKRPRWFRSGTAYYDDVAVRVIQDLGLGIAGYSVAGDEGASLSAARVAAKTLAAKNGDILLYHLNRPRSGTRAGLERALPQLLEKGFVFVRL